MNIIYADEPPHFNGTSVFLAGPTPRRAEVPSWRPEALSLLETMNFTGTVLIPERRDWTKRFDYSDQVEWEFLGLESAKRIVFWIPRNLETLPGFTTNVEFGRYVGSGRILYGRPPDAPHTSYLDWLYQKMTGQEPISDLASLMRTATEKAG